MTRRSWTEFGDSQLPGARVLDNAEGVLIGLRRCEASAAFDEILGVARQHALPVFAVAEALVQLAGGDAPSETVSGAADSVAKREWGAMLDRSSTPAAPTDGDTADSP